MDRRTAQFTRYLFENLRNDASTYGAATFTDRKAQTFVHRNRVDQGDNHLDVVAWHYHLNTFWQLTGTGHVRGTEVELRTVTLEEWRVTTTLVLAQNVDLCLELGVRSDRARLGQYLTTLNFLTLGATQQHTHVLTSTAFVQQLAEHLNTGAGSLGGSLQAHNLDLVANAHDTALDTTGDHSTAAGDGEHVFDRQQEGLLDVTYRLGNVGVQRLNQLLHSRHAQLGSITLQRLERRTDDDRRVVAREVVGLQKLTHFHLDQLQQLSVIHHVCLVHEYHDVGYTYLTGQQDVLARLRHGAVSGRNHQN